jgi:hypothetical protein
MDIGFRFPQWPMIVEIIAVYYSRTLLCSLFTTRDLGRQLCKTRLRYAFYFNVIEDSSVHCTNTVMSYFVIM